MSRITVAEWLHLVGGLGYKPYGRVGGEETRTIRDPPRTARTSACDMMDKPKEKAASLASEVPIAALIRFLAPRLARDPWFLPELALLCSSYQSFRKGRMEIKVVLEIESDEPEEPHGATVSPEVVIHIMSKTIRKG
ncbi:hypothetical protein llap_10427 [Limosa lapponica baueri]|uniref:Uncharacterized protein n=1 Tax=Limosa lapponica baueri TaxID=1758121 RepID=A0A2I0TZR3_LIMLA|nr:hypothetical protein llap_10427 [Limosa lapponica baueri]